MATIYKKLIVLSLSFVILLVFCSCAKDNNTSGNNISPLPTSSEKQTTNEPQATGSPQTGNEQQTDNQQPDAGYEDIECRDIPSEQWKTVGFNHTESNGTVVLPIPKDWVFTKTATATYSVTRDGKTIGKLIGIPAMPNKHYEYNTGSGNKLKSVYTINESGTGSNITYSRVISFNYTAVSMEKYVTPEIDYAELSDSAVSKIMSQTNRQEWGNPSISGNYTLSNKSKTIAILGNSFINSSQIGQFLTQMCNTSGNGYSVMASSIVMAHVGTYSKNSTFISDIASGKYCAVFQCEFYAADEVNNLQAIKDACDKSGTLLVLFPAHNEGAKHIENAQSRYNVAVMSWQEEINKIIKSGTGVDYYDMCINDTYKHSTNLAGYVGAHIIYRTLFSKVPPTITGTADCNMSYIKNKLGNYVTTCESSYNNKIVVSETIKL